VCMVGYLSYLYSMYISRALRTPVRHSNLYRKDSLTTASYLQMVVNGVHYCDPVLKSKPRRSDRVMTSDFSLSTFILISLSLFAAVYCFRRHHIANSPRLVQIRQTN
jgi:hypothetical protein